MCQHFRHILEKDFKSRLTRPTSMETGMSLWHWPLSHLSERLEFQRGPSFLKKEGLRFIQHRYLRSLGREGQRSAVSEWCSRRCRREFKARAGDDVVFPDVRRKLNWQGVDVTTFVPTGIQVWEGLGKLRKYHRKIFVLLAVLSFVRE